MRSPVPAAVGTGSLLCIPVPLAPPSSSWWRSHDHRVRRGDRPVGDGSRARRAGAVLGGVVDPRGDPTGAADAGSLGGLGEAAPGALAVHGSTDADLERVETAAQAGARRGLGVLSRRVG